MAEHACGTRVAEHERDSRATCHSCPTSTAHQNGDESHQVHYVSSTTCGVTGMVTSRLFEVAVFNAV